MKIKTLILMLFFQNILFSQNPYLELKFGISDIQYYEQPAETPGFHNGNLFQINLGNEFVLNNRNLYLNTSIFYRESKNSLNVDWLIDVPDNKKNDFVFYTKLVGLQTEIKKKISLLKKNNIHLTPKFGLILGYFTSQDFKNPIHNDEGFTIYYDNYNLDEYKNKVKIVDDFYLANNFGFDLNYNLNKFNIYINPEIEYQLNHIFRKEQFDESYIYYNLGVGIMYDF